MDVFEKIDMRTQTFNVPPQEVLGFNFVIFQPDEYSLDPDQGQCYRVCERHHVLQGEECHQCRDLFISIIFIQNSKVRYRFGYKKLKI